MGIEEKLPSGVLLTSVEAIAGWMRKTSFRPATMGLACCAIEMMSFGGPRFDAGRWGQEVFRASPRQADLLIVSGRVSQKMAPVVRQVYDQMPEPRASPSFNVIVNAQGFTYSFRLGYLHGLLCERGRLLSLFLLRRPRL